MRIDAETREKLRDRDLTLDLARVVCVLLVVIVHLLFAGVVRSDDGIAIERTVEAQGWFPLASWLADVMPLFFVVGGFAVMAGWISAERRGIDADHFVRLRLVRLARPALPLFVFFAVALGVARLVGAPAELVDAIAIGVGSPLWFLGAYMLVQALAPVMIRLHRARPVTTLAALIAAAIAVDAVRFSLDMQLLGLPNVAFVWLAIQQLGFFMHDGLFRRLPSLALLLIALAGYALLVPTVSLVGYSWNMLSNQYPPTVPFIVLGVVQASLITLFHRPLSALMRTRSALTFVGVAGSRLITLYLWHLPVIMLLIGVQLLLPFALSEPGSGRWWWERIPALVLVLAVVWLISLPLARFERPLPGMDAPRHPSRPVTVIAVLAFMSAPMLVMVFGLDLQLALLGVATSAAALLLIRGRGQHPVRIGSASGAVAP